jgi:ATP phosphoribosyltransferase
MSAKLIFALPSKGRLMEQCAEALARAGLSVSKSGAARGYRGEIAELSDVEVQFVSSSEIAHFLQLGTAHLGITGEDLVRETIPDCDHRVSLLQPLGFGHADVVVAVPICWIDVSSMADLEETSQVYRRVHGRPIRVATKYMNLTRRFFAQRGVAGYRIVPSLGATEGAPAADLSEIIVDITTTGATLRANGLKVLEDGVILKSQAHVIASKLAPWSARTRQAKAAILECFAKARGADDAPPPQSRR